MPHKRTSKKRPAAKPKTPSKARAGRPSALLDTRIVYCGDCLDQLAKLPDGCVDLIYIGPPFNRNYEVFWGETKEKRAFQDRHASTQAYIDYMRPRCRQLARVLKPTGSFYCHCDRPVAKAPQGQACTAFPRNRFPKRESQEAEDCQLQLVPPFLGRVCEAE